MAPAGPVLGTLPMLAAKKGNSGAGAGETSASSFQTVPVGQELWISATDQRVSAAEEKQTVDGMRKELVQHLKAERYREALTLTHAILRTSPGDRLVSELLPVLEEKIALDDDRKRREERDNSRNPSDGAAESELSEDDDEGDSSDFDDEEDESESNEEDKDGEEESDSAEEMDMGEEEHSEKDGNKENNGIHQ